MLYCAKVPKFSTEETDISRHCITLHTYQQRKTMQMTSLAWQHKGAVLLEARSQLYQHRLHSFVEIWILVCCSMLDIVYKYSCLHGGKYKTKLLLFFRIGNLFGNLRRRNLFSGIYAAIHGYLYGERWYFFQPQTHETYKIVLLRIRRPTTQ